MDANLYANAAAFQHTDTDQHPNANGDRDEHQHTDQYGNGDLYGDGNLDANQHVGSAHQNADTDQNTDAIGYAYADINTDRANAHTDDSVPVHHAAKLIDPARKLCQHT